MIRWILPLAMMLPAALRAQDCDEPQSQMNICSAKSYQQADARLNDIYKQAVASATASGGEAPALLRTAQRAWITYRDAACAAEAAPYEGGSIQPLIRTSCLKKLTERRSADLHETYLKN